VGAGVGVEGWIRSGVFFVYRGWLGKVLGGARPVMAWEHMRPLLVDRVPWHGGGVRAGPTAHNRASPPPSPPRRANRQRTAARPAPPQAVPAAPPRSPFSTVGRGMGRGRAARA
jgi:hypothetical protein